jgi:hypothetical protein
MATPIKRRCDAARSALACSSLFMLLGCHHRDQPAPAAESTAPAPAAAISPSRPKNSMEALASCQPETRASLGAIPQFVMDERVNPAGVQLKVRFLVNNYGFTVNPYVTADAGRFTPQDDEDALDYVRHLTFTPAASEECQSLKIQMVGTFRMSKDGGQWVTIFDSHPVYTFDSQNKVTVNPN